MMVYLQQISGDLKKVELLRLDLKWCVQANGSPKFQNQSFPVISIALPLATAREPEKP
jgi:hypothetical protein